MSYNTLSRSQKDVIDEFNKVLHLDKLYTLPDKISISTITAATKLGIDLEFNLANLAKYVPLKDDGIAEVKFGSSLDETTNRTILKKKVKSKKLSDIQKKTQFFNQVSLSVKLPRRNNPIRVKIFGNGSIHMPGCATAYDFLTVIEKIIEASCKTSIIADGVTIINPFVNDPMKLTLDCINSTTIAMINSDFRMPYSINREQLYNIFNNDKEYSCYPCVFDPVRHTCVNIKYRVTESGKSETKATILVFEPGSIIITGAKNCTDIANAYIFINGIILKYWREIVKDDWNKCQLIYEYMISNSLVS